jgi:hydrogenase maturation protease
MGTRVIGIGQAAAGDDGVGIAVLRQLGARALPPGVAIFEIAEATGLIPLLETRDTVILVDAVLGEGPPGEVIELEADALDDFSAKPLSTHGVDVAQAIALARTLFPDSAAPQVRIVGVRIAPPARYVHGLSPEVAAAVPRAVAAVCSRLGGG